VNSRVHVEDVLQRLGHDWPENDSIVEGVLRGLDAMPVCPADNLPRGRSIRRVLMAAASVALCAALWYVSSSLSSRSVYAQTRDAIRRARSFEVTSRFFIDPRFFADGGSRDQLRLTMAFERGVGFREERPHEVFIGNQDGSWHYVKDAKQAVKTRGPSVSRMVDRFLDHDLAKVFPDTGCERYADQDQVINGQSCEAFLLTNAQRNFGDFDADRQRSIVLKDDQSRIVQMNVEVRPMDQWITRGVIEVKYDAPLDPTLFQSNFPDDVRVVDADSAFEQFVDLDHAIYREERSGLWYAIHHAERFENGCLFFITSVRGTEATLKEYPLTERPLQPGKVFIDGPASQYPSPYSRGVRGQSIELAKVDHRGINVCWWVLIPSDQTAQVPFDVGNGRVWVPASITPSFSQYWKDKFTDKKGITHPLTWDIELPLPMPATFPSLESISKKVYADLTTFEGVTFKFPNMGNRGMTSVRWYDMNEVTLDQYVKAVADDVRWWKNGSPMDDPRRKELSDPRYWERLANPARSK